MCATLFCKLSWQLNRQTKQQVHLRLCVRAQTATEISIKTLTECNTPQDSVTSTVWDVYPTRSPETNVRDVHFYKTTDVLKTFLYAVTSCFQKP